MKGTTNADFGKIFGIQTFEQDVFGAFGTNSHFNVLSVVVHERHPFEEMGVFVCVRKVFGSYPNDDPFGRFPPKSHVLALFLGNVVVIEGFVNEFFDRVEIFLGCPARRTGKRVGDRLESGSGFDSELLFPESGTVEVRALRAGEFFHIFFSPHRIADFRENTRFATVGPIDFRSIRV